MCEVLGACCNSRQAFDGKIPKADTGSALTLKHLLFANNLLHDLKKSMWNVAVSARNQYFPTPSFPTEDRDQLGRGGGVGGVDEEQGGREAISKSSGVRPKV